MRPASVWSARARRSRPALDALPAGATLHLDVGRLAADAVVALEALLDDGLVWLLAGIDPTVPLPPSLGHRLGAVRIDLPPLAERPADAAALADVIVARLARRTGRPAPPIAPDAVDALAHHPWPGDVAEMEAVLGAAFLRAHDRIETAHIVFAAPASVPSAPPPTAAPPQLDHDLEFVLAELAHELRNPMVTVKTYARHLPALLEDEELRARFDTLTTDAIERMDGLLENVLAFARLGTPRPEPVQVAPLLARVLGEVEPELAGRAVHVRQDAAPGARCAADPEHLAYALRNLFTGIVREVPAREELALEATANGVVTLRFAAGTEAADRLRRLAAPGDDVSLADPSLLPLGFRLARAVLERNGGTLAVVPDGTRSTSVVIRLPAAPAEEAP